MPSSSRPITGDIHRKSCTFGWAEGDAGHTASTGQRQQARRPSAAMSLSYMAVVSSSVFVWFFYHL